MELLASVHWVATHENAKAAADPEIAAEEAHVVLSCALEDPAGRPHRSVLSYNVGVSVRIDWSKRADYIRARHAVDAEWASEAVRDQHAVWLVPDPASRSGHAVRVIGYSRSAGAVLTVVLIDAEADPAERPDGDWWGSNAWMANWRDQRIYGEAES